MEMNCFECVHWCQHYQRVSNRKGDEQLRVCIGDGIIREWVT